MAGRSICPVSPRRQYTRKRYPRPGPHLRSFGDPGAVPVIEQQASVSGANALAGLVNVVVDGARADVVVLDTGLVVVPGMPRLKIRKAKPRMYQLLSAAPDKLTSLPGSRFIPVEEIVTVQFKRVPVRYELGLHDGRTVKIRWGGQCEEIGQGWQALANVVSRAAATNAPASPFRRQRRGD